MKDIDHPMAGDAFHTKGVSCPWCGARMSLRKATPVGRQPSEAVLVCDRKPADHTIALGAGPALRHA